MANQNLNSQPALDNYRGKFGAITLTEITDWAIISIATLKGGEKALDAAIRKKFKVKRPQVGQSVSMPDIEGRLIGFAPGQLFFVFEYEQNNALQYVSEIFGKLGELAYLTDQSDGWVTLNIAGSGCIEALQRICTIDLYPQEFTQGKIARTRMEHMAAIIICSKPDDYLIMSPRSSAASMLHAIEVSIGNIL